LASATTRTTSASMPSPRASTSEQAGFERQHDERTSRRVFEGQNCATTARPAVPSRIQALALPSS
jgi:hypothetical protein